MAMDDDLSGDDYKMRKHSVLLDGHQTSVSVEDAFWNGMLAIAKERGQSVNRLVTELDHARTTNLSSTIRVFVLSNLKQI